MNDRSVRVIGFGPVSEVVAVEEIALNLPATATEVEQAIRNRLPGLQEFSLILAIDGAIVQPETVVETAKEIALLPPFAGG